MAMPAPMQSINTTQRKKAQKEAKDRFRASAKSTEEPSKEAARSTRKAGSSLAH